MFEFISIMWALEAYYPRWTGTQFNQPLTFCIYKSNGSESSPNSLPHPGNWLSLASKECITTGITSKPPVIIGVYSIRTCLPKHWSTSDFPCPSVVVWWIDLSDQVCLSAPDFKQPQVLKIGGQRSRETVVVTALFPGFVWSLSPAQWKQTLYEDCWAPTSMGGSIYIKHRQDTDIAECIIYIHRLTTASHWVIAAKGLGPHKLGMYICP